MMSSYFKFIEEISMVKVGVGKYPVDAPANGSQLGHR